MDAALAPGLATAAHQAEPGSRTDKDKCSGPPPCTRAIAVIHHADRFLQCMAECPTQSRARNTGKLD